MTRSIAISFSVLHDEELKGAWQVHAPFSFTSIELMRLFRVPYVVLARHPLDHLIALACHWRKSRMVGVIQRHMSAGRPLVNTALAPVTVDTLCAKQVADVVKGLISEGYLFHVLSWLANWLGSRDVANSVMIRMECLNENPGFWFDQMANLLKVGENESRAASAMYTREFSARRSAANDTDEYPHGWTGAGQLWRSYCSEREIDAYNLGVRSFLTATPHRNALFGAFEDLLVE
ncbi:MAG: hypothetical protein HOP18_09390 [Deltaproteobacteria bacterium]|nr:hypothetical protein [Deltaproteobacteria bacterium]